MFADGGTRFTHVKTSAEAAEPAALVFKRERVASMVVGIALFTMGLPLLIIGSISTAEDRLGM